MDEKTKEDIETLRTLIIQRSGRIAVIDKTIKSLNIEMEQISSEIEILNKTISEIEKRDNILELL